MNKLNQEATETGSRLTTRQEGGKVVRGWRDRAKNRKGLIDIDNSMVIQERGEEGRWKRMERG